MARPRTPNSVHRGHASRSGSPEASRSASPSFSDPPKSAAVLWSVVACSLQETSTEPPLDGDARVGRVHHVGVLVAGEEGPLRRMAEHLSLEAPGALLARPARGRLRPGGAGRSPP